MTPSPLLYAGRRRDGVVAKLADASRMAGAMTRPTRRGFIARVAAAAALARPSAAASQAVPPARNPAPSSPTTFAVRVVDSADPQAPDGQAGGPRGPVPIGEFNIVGQYDVDWLLEPPLQRLLDNMAASPSAFGAVRFFHALDSGTPAKTIDDDPLDGGIVWPDAASPMNFSRTFDA